MEETLKGYVKLPRAGCLSDWAYQTIVASYTVDLSPDQLLTKIMFLRNQTSPKFKKKKHLSTFRC